MGLSLSFNQSPPKKPPDNTSIYNLYRQAPRHEVIPNFNSL